MDRFGGSASSWRANSVQPRKMSNFILFFSSDLCEKNPTALVNQFPYESCLSVKDLLAAILMQINHGEGPEWYQVGFLPIN